MIPVGLIGHGYWGQLIEKKLDLLAKLVFIQTSQNYDPKLFDSASWIFIATPAASHYSIAKDCLNRGKNVFLEKPFCASFHESQELVNLASNKNALLYIDNVFIKRSEFLSIQQRDFKDLKFIWRKSGPFNSNLLDDLLYHDLYILISLAGYQNISFINFRIHKENTLRLKMTYGKINIEFKYDRAPNLDRAKLIIIDGTEIIFKNSKEDPLKEIISDCLSEKVDFKFNQTLNLQTMELMSIIRRIDMT